MPTVNAGSILIAQTTGTWQNEQNWELTGTVAPGDVVAPYQLYLGPSASSTPNYYVGYYITTSLFTGLPQYYNCQVSAYNSTTKVATVGWLSGDASPPVGTQWYAFTMFPVLSAYQWQRNGVDISGATGRVYTTVAADIGATISYYTEGGSLPKGSDPNAINKPTVTTVNQGSPTYTIGGSAPSGNFITSSADFTLLGAFRLSDPYDGLNFSIVPASKSPSAQKCLYVSGGIPAPTSGKYLTIPTLTTNYSTSWAGFPSGSISSVITSKADVFEGLFGIGVTSADLGGGSHAIDSNYFLTSFAAAYSFQPSSVMLRRSTTLSNTTPADLFILHDPLQTNSRWRSGAISEIPAQYQTALGGDTLVAGWGASIHSNLSQGPASFVFNSANISPALAKANSGTSISGTATTMVLAATANTTTADYYKDSFLICGSANTRITAYNQTTRTVTVADAVLPTTASAYRVIPSVIGKQLIGYDQSLFFASDAYGAIWDSGGASSSATSGFIANNTKSFVCMTNAVFGVLDYGISYNALPNGVGGGARLYNPYVVTTGNADQTSHFYFKQKPSVQFVVYSTDDMATVAAGTATYSSLTPKAVFCLQIPYETVSIYHMQFDNSDGKLYLLISLFKDYSSPTVVVYQCNKWSA